MQSVLQTPPHRGLTHLASWNDHDKLYSILGASTTEALIKDGSSEQPHDVNLTTPFAGYGVSAKQGLSSHMVMEAIESLSIRNLNRLHRSQEDAFTVQEKLSSPLLESGKRLDVASDSEISSLNVPGFSEDMSFFSVFDGHGGDEVAQHCSDRLHQHFTRQLLQSLGITSCSQIPMDDSSFSLAHQTGSPVSGRSLIESPFNSSNVDLVSEALRMAFKLTDDELMGTEAGEDMGATACIAIVGRRHIWVAHCGDSRAVIQRGGDSVALTMDHKPDRPDELTRIKSLGGRVANKRVMGMLAMSRSIGDHYLRPYVIAEPEVDCVERSADDEVLIIATDGLWDVFSCTEATNLARRCISRSKERGMSRQSSCRVSASVLAKAAIERGSRDNITVIVVDISPVADRTSSIGDITGHGAGEVMSPAAAVAEEEADRVSSQDSPPHSPSPSDHSRPSSSLPRRSSTKSLNKCVILKSSGSRRHKHHHHHSSKDAVISGLSPTQSNHDRSSAGGQEEEGKEDQNPFSFQKMSNVMEGQEVESSEDEGVDGGSESCSSSESESSNSVIAAKATITLPVAAVDGGTSRGGLAAIEGMEFKGEPGS